MPLVSINILTKNRAQLLQKALLSVQKQTFTDYEIILVDDGSTDGTIERLKDFKIENLKIISHQISQGITISRQEALEASRGEYVAVLDDDDEWVDKDKLKKQVEYLNTHRDCVLVGGGIEIRNSNIEIRNKSKIQNSKSQIIRFRAETDGQIRRTMLLRNNFFTSTVMFRRQAAIETGGFVKDQDDFAEDYDLWLRLGQKGKMHNFQQVFAAYRQPSYNKEKFRAFLKKQVRLISRHRNDYSWFLLAYCILKIRLMF